MREGTRHLDSREGGLTDDNYQIKFNIYHVLFKLIATLKRRDSIFESNRYNGKSLRCPLRQFAIQTSSLINIPINQSRFEPLNM